MNNIDCALKYNNTASTIRCHYCGVKFVPEVGYQVALRDTFDFLCDSCIAEHVPELLAARDAAETWMPIKPPDDNELLAMACEFDVGPEPILNGRLEWWKQYHDDKLHHVTVKNMGNPDPDQPDRWAILSGGGNRCLNKEGDWVYQPRPSSREDDFYEQCRYASAQEAIEYYRRWSDAVLTWGREQKDRTRLNYTDPDCPKVRF